MENISDIKFKDTGSREELLPGFALDFPLITSYIEIDRFQGRSAPWHWHKEVELFYTERGTITYHTPDGTLSFPAGSGGLVRSGVLHTTHPAEGVDGTAAMLYLFDAPCLIGGHSGSLISRKYVAPMLSASQPALTLLRPDEPMHAVFLDKLRDSFALTPDAPGYELRLSALLSEIWYGLFCLSAPDRGRADGAHHSDEKIKLAMGYIHEHYAEKLTLAEIAAASYISERECFRAFRQNLDMTPVEYIKNYRVQRACAMLANGTESLSTVAQTCGLSSSSYFGKVFREYMGCTPKEFQQKTLAGS